MPILRYFRKMQLLDGLIRRRTTGNQQQFARKAGISRSLLNIYISEMRELGFPISFCRKRNTYYYDEEGSIVESLFSKSPE